MAQLVLSQKMSLKLVHVSHWVLVEEKMDETYVGHLNRSKLIAMWSSRVSNNVIPAIRQDKQRQMNGASQICKCETSKTISIEINARNMS